MRPIVQQIAVQQRPGSPAVCSGSRCRARGLGVCRFTARDTASYVRWPASCSFLHASPYILRRPPVDAWLLISSPAGRAQGGSSSACLSVCLSVCPSSPQRSSTSCCATSTSASDRPGALALRPCSCIANLAVDGAVHRTMATATRTLISSARLSPTETPVGNRRYGLLTPWPPPSPAPRNLLKRVWGIFPASAASAEAARSPPRRHCRPAPSYLVRGLVHGRTRASLLWEAESDAHGCIAFACVFACSPAPRVVRLGMGMKPPSVRAAPRKESPGAASCLLLHSRNLRRSPSPGAFRIGEPLVTGPCR